MNDATPPRRARRSPARIIGLVLAAVLVIAVAGMVWHQARGGSPVARQSPGPASPATSGPAGASSAASPSPAAATAGCATQPRPIVPASMRIDQMDVSTSVLALGLDASGAAAAPPKDDPSAVAWFNKGPKPGSSQGKVVLSTHTYHLGGALGNRLYDSRNGLRKGDIIRLADSSGTTVCYRFDHLTKILVKDYDPTSTILYDNSGAPMAAIVICWDYDAATSDWGSRVIFYATPVSGSSAR